MLFLEVSRIFFFFSNIFDLPLVESTHLEPAVMEDPLYFQQVYLRTPEMDTLLLKKSLFSYNTDQYFSILTVKHLENI